MNTIFKYKLENIDQQTIEIPLPARILSVVEDNDDIVLYAVVDDDQDVPKIPVDISIKGTGDVIESGIGLYTFLGTVKLFNGNEIWHVFYMYSGDDRVSRQTGRLGEPIIEEFHRELPGKGGVLVA
jgi:hypothetical protein